MYKQKADEKLRSKGDKQKKTDDEDLVIKEEPTEKEDGEPMEEEVDSLDILPPPSPISEIASLHELSEQNTFEDGEINDTADRAVKPLKDTDTDGEAENTVEATFDRIVEQFNSPKSPENRQVKVSKIGSKRKTTDDTDTNCEADDTYDRIVNQFNSPNMAENRLKVSKKKLVDYTDTDGEEADDTYDRIVKQFNSPKSPEKRQKVSKSKSKRKIDIRKITARFYCGKILNLDFIESKLSKTYYDIKLGSLTLYRKLPEKCVAQIYSSGKVLVYVATMDREIVKKRCRQIARLLQKIDSKINFKDYDLIQIRALAQMNYRINLPTLAKSNPKIMYEPELGPELGAAAAYYNLKKYSTKLTIHHTGKIVFSCKSNIEEIMTSMKIIEEQLYESRICK